MLSLNYVMEIFSNWYLSHVSRPKATYRSQHINIIPQYQPLSLSKRLSFILSLFSPLTSARTDSPVQLFFAGFSSFPGNYRWRSKREGKARGSNAICGFFIDLHDLPGHGNSIFISQYWNVYDYSLNVQDIAQTKQSAKHWIFLLTCYQAIQIASTRVKEENRLLHFVFNLSFLLTSCKGSPMLSKPVWLKVIQQFLRNGKVPEANAKAIEKNRTTTRILTAT